MKSFLHIFAQLRAAYANKTSPEGLQLLARVYWRLILAAGFFVIVVAIALGALQLLAVLGGRNQAIAQVAFKLFFFAFVLVHGMSFAAEGIN